MKPLPATWLRIRIVLLLLFFSILFLVVLARAYQLQILQGPKLATLAERQYQRMVPLLPRRGIIYDRKGEELAISMEVDSVFAQPGEIAHPGEAARKVAPILGKPAGALLKKLKEEKPFVWLGRGISPEKRKALEELGMEGIEFLKETKRFYPQKEIAGHILGFAGLDSQGLEGVELGYDGFIRGEPGYVLISKDALGRALNPENREFRSSVEGSDLILTIDQNIQHTAERELAKAVEASSAKGGMAVVMDPRTGEILALAVAPAFDPNRFGDYPAHLLKNRVITDTFEPGSTFKVFVVAAALEERVMSPTDVFFCENGAYAIGGRVIHDVHKYGWLSLTEIIKVSSNIGAAKVGRKLGRAQLHRYLKGFGFGSKTGVDLPGEVSGFLSAPQHWSEVGLANISFGQGISLTAMQLTTALAAIANGGVFMRPYIVKAVVDRHGNLLRENRPREMRRVISSETARTMATMMKTVTEEGGTGKLGALAGFDTAGKTGTAQKAAVNHRGYSDKRIGSFIGFAPGDHPQVVISVIIDEPGGIRYGGVVAAPAFRGIGEQVLPYLEIYPRGVTYLAQGKRAPEREAPAKSAHAPEEGPDPEPGIMPDFSGQSIRQVIRTAQRLKLDLKLVGSGRAVGQSPPPGQVLQGETPGFVRFQPLG
ncbi:MAG: transpeptidase family protein [Deltaproteobacteria bacterium]|nr:transpeptidase family protein [Deltaproteobacteria bacterium]